MEHPRWVWRRKIDKHHVPLEIKNGTVSLFTQNPELLGCEKSWMFDLLCKSKSTKPQSGTNHALKCCISHIRRNTKGNHDLEVMFVDFKIREST